MLDSLGVAAGLLALLLGAGLIYDSFSSTMSSWLLVTGACLSTLGLITMLLATRSWWRRRWPPRDTEIPKKNVTVGDDHVR